MSNDSELKSSPSGAAAVTERYAGDGRPESHRFPIAGANPGTRANSGLYGPADVTPSCGSPSPPFVSADANCGRSAPHSAAARTDRRETGFLRTRTIRCVVSSGYDDDFPPHPLIFECAHAAEDRQ